MPRFCGSCGMNKHDKRYHTKIRGIGTYCHKELFYLDENGEEHIVPSGEEDKFKDRSYYRRVTDEVGGVEELMKEAGLLAKNA